MYVAFTRARDEIFLFDHEDSQMDINLRAAFNSAKEHEKENDPDDRTLKVAVISGATNSVKMTTTVILQIIWKCLFVRIIKMRMFNSLD